MIAPCHHLLHLLSNHIDAVCQVAVIVNDMAEINIDAELVRGQASGHEVQLNQDQLVELSNGCICCTLRDDLLKVLNHVCTCMHGIELVSQNKLRLCCSARVHGLTSHLGCSCSTTSQEA